MNQPQKGIAIRELRLENGLTQEQFAALLGVTYSTVNRACERTYKAITTGYG